jgi:hypothetical protein
MLFRNSSSEGSMVTNGGNHMGSSSIVFGRPTDRLDIWKLLNKKYQHMYVKRSAVSFFYRKRKRWIHYGMVLYLFGRLGTQNTPSKWITRGLRFHGWCTELELEQAPLVRALQPEQEL